MALDPNQLLAKLFGWVWRTKTPLFDADVVADLVDGAKKPEVTKALKQLVDEGKLEAHGAKFALPGAIIDSAAKSAPPAAPKSSRREPAPEPDYDDEPAPPPAKREREREHELARPEKAAPKAAEPALSIATDAPEYTWLIDVCDALVDYVQEFHPAQVAVRDLEGFAGEDFAGTYPDETNIPGRIYQLCEFLATKGILTATGTPGTYTCHPWLIEREQSVASKLDRMDLKRATKREYTIECAVPQTGLKGLAVLLYDASSWLGSELTFTDEDGRPYIEVHHINRVALGGNESLENLCLLNPFHHKMCHFATDPQIEKMRAELTGLMQQKLSAMVAGLGGARKATRKSAEKPAAKKAAPAKKPAQAGKAAAKKAPAKKAAAKKAAK